MKIIKPSVEIVDATNPLEHIEKAYRLCYKSEDKICEGSAEKLIRSMAIGKGHWSPTEHFNFVLQLRYPDFHMLRCNSKFVNRTFESGRPIVSGSARSFVDVYEETSNEVVKDTIKRVAGAICSKYHCGVLFENIEGVYDDGSVKVIQIEDLQGKKELEEHGWFTAKFVCDRGVSHEIVRHRVASYSQSSTRYCNYSKEKFGNQISVIRPCFFPDKIPEGIPDGDNTTIHKWNTWKSACEDAERYYFDMIRAGATPQEARSVLPNSLKTEIMMTTNLKNWKHFFTLRCDVAAHPQIRELAIPLKEMAHEKFPTVVD